MGRGKFLEWMKGFEGLRGEFSRIFSEMRKSRQVRMFFLLNPRQIAVVEARYSTKGGRVQPEHLAMFPFESGLLACLELPYAEEEFFSRLGRHPPSSDRVLSSYFASLETVRRAVSRLAGRKFSVNQTARLVLEIAECLGPEVFTPLEEGMFCMECGKFAISLADSSTPIFESCVKQEHDVVHVRALRIDEGVMVGWEEGLILEGYVGSELEADGWWTMVGSEVQGLAGSVHEIDVLAEKEDNYALIECKHLAPYNEVGYEDVVKTLGKMQLVEEAIREEYKREGRKPKKIVKSFVTTGRMTETRMIRKMASLLPDILVAEKSDLLSGLKGFKEQLANLTENGAE